VCKKLHCLFLQAYKQLPKIQRHSPSSERLQCYIIQCSFKSTQLLYNIYLISTCILLLNDYMFRPLYMAIFRSSTISYVEDTLSVSTCYILFVVSKESLRNLKTILFLICIRTSGNGRPPQTALVRGPPK
jgi:hypothetical protein